MTALIPIYILQEKTTRKRKPIQNTTRMRGVLEKPMAHYPRETWTQN